MKHLFKSPIVFIVITLALMISALGVTPAFADDETPPAPATEEPTQPPASEATQPPVIATEPPVSATQPPVEATQAPEVTEATAPAENAPVVEILSEVPENIDVVALDENNQPLPLASQDTAEVMEEADPKWCPEGVPPNSPSCSANFPSIDALLADMQANPGFYSQNGVIYFERAASVTFTTPVILDDSLTSLGASYNTLSAYNITLQGGWAGGTSAKVPGHSLFDGSGAFIQVGTAANPWAGNVTINDIQVGDATVGGASVNNGVTVYTSSGDITLNNVDVMQQEGNYYTAYLQSDSGDISIGSSLNPVIGGPNSVFDGNNASPAQNQGFFASTTTGEITITDATFQQAFQPGATAYSNGATLSAPTITLNNVTAKGNDGSGVYVNGTGSTIVNIFGGTYINNKRYGVEVVGSLLNEGSTPTCSGNVKASASNPCYNVTPESAPTITVNDVTVESDTLGGWILNFSAIGSASDVQDITPSVSCTPALGSVLPVGVTTPVACTATDSVGLTASASGNVTVADTTAPSLSLPSDITVVATGPNGTPVTFTTSATDITDGVVPVTCVPASGSLFPVGTTPVTCSAVDGAGNPAQDSFNVIAGDTGAPFLTLPADMHITVHMIADAIVTYTASATDVIDGSVPVICVPPSGSHFPEGTTLVNCSATDSSGNMTNGSFAVTVEVDKIVKSSLYNVTQQTQTQLPGVLGQGDSFVSALRLEFSDQTAEARGLMITLSFPVPDDMQGANLVVVYWDGSEWITMPGGSLIDHYFVITVSKPGFYALVSQ